MRKNILKILFTVLVSVSLAGCTFIFQSGRRSDTQKIEDLSRQLDELNQTKRLLEERLSSEINDQQVKLQMMDKGLVISFVADVIFDSGKAKIKTEAYPVLDKVARVLTENVPQLNIGIEGHTDNVPVKLSKWKSNWELSSARSLSVLHYLADKKGISPDRLSAIGYGEYHPVDSNDTRVGRQANRRVEIVIIPQITKVKEAKDSGNIEPKENLK